MTEKNYHSLHENKIFMGGAKDVESMVKNEGIEVVVDLREESTGCAYPEANVAWIKIPLGDNATESEEVLYKKAIDEVVNAYRQGQKVAFHCGGGKGRTGTVAAGTLMELGVAKSLDEAEAKAKSIRSIIDIKPSQTESLKKIFGD
ncbi:dual specificity protein phosphatase family protein [Paenibacillus sp. EPM92]|uniref:protein-tyrosine phosphatase family protein n=1 Tax=Paenibacillus sp. EPM92 TaxID=1561195 RepID=UPI001915C7B5|nr:dual specificity protein phosphatase family protein [Paenibacillus sp. EPM92]